MKDINKVIRFSLGLNQSKTNECKSMRLHETLKFVRKSKRDVVVNIIKSDDTYFIIFRGSRLGNWYDNLRVKQHKLPYQSMFLINSRIRVHEGFIDAYKSVRYDIQKWMHLDSPAHKNMKVIVGGHSLGGALATLCAVDLQFNFPELDIKCISLGSPRVGNWWFARSYNKRVPNTIRVIHGNDIVARLPPAWLFYKHVGKRMHQGNKWKFWLLPWGSVMDHLAYEVFK